MWGVPSAGEACQDEAKLVGEEVKAQDAYQVCDYEATRRARWSSQVVSGARGEEEFGSVSNSYLDRE